MGIIHNQQNDSMTIKYNGVELGSIVLSDFPLNRSIANCVQDILNRLEAQVSINRRNLRIAIISKPTNANPTTPLKYYIWHGAEGETPISEGQLAWPPVS